MENNWKEKVIETISHLPNCEDFETQELWENKILELMNLVFEATKKECANKAGKHYDINGQLISITENILNINKPNI